MSDHRKRLSVGESKSVARAIAYKIKSQEYAIPYPKLTEEDQRTASNVAAIARSVGSARVRNYYNRFDEATEYRHFDKNWTDKISTRNIYLWAISGQNDVFYDLLDPEYREDHGPRTLMFGVTAEEVEARKALLIAVLEEAEETERGRTR